MFANLYNFRDLASADSSRLKPGRLFRSDALSRMDDADWQLFLTLHVRTVVDLRTPEEVGDYGRVRPDSDIEYHNLSILKTEWDQNPLTQDISVAQYLANRYLDLTAEGQTELRTAVGLLAEPAAAPAVIHCGGGRDRAGILSALILGLLDVSDDAIAVDYARSQEAAAKTAALISRRQGTPFTHAPEFAETPAEAMRIVLRELRRQHGSIAGYARSIGIPAAAITTLRAHMIKP
jgi:protein-tyrosine phosphatase